MNDTPATTDFDRQMLECTPGNFPWDEWERQAVAAGVAAELAALGRSVMREAYQHDWCEPLRYECGVNRPETADGMIQAALQEPELTADRWDWLLATDGLRFDPADRTPMNELDIEWTALRRQWQDERPVADRCSSLALKRHALRFVEDFYNLDQLTMLDVQASGLQRTVDGAILWADFTVIEHDPVYPRVKCSGVVRVQVDAGADFEGAVFQRIEEGA